MSRISVKNEVMAVVMGFIPTTISYMKDEFLDYRRSKRRIQVAVLP